MLRHGRDTVQVLVLSLLELDCVCICRGLRMRGWADMRYPSRWSQQTVAPQVVPHERQSPKPNIQTVVAANAAVLHAWSRSSALLPPKLSPLEIESSFFFFV